MRLAVASPDQINDPVLLRVPAASLKALGQYGNQLAKRHMQPEMVITSLSFDFTVSHPQLTFKAVGFVDEDQFAEVQETLEKEHETIQNILGLSGVGPGVAETEAEDEDDEPKPKRRAAPEPEDEDDEPKPKRRAAPEPEDEDEDEEPKRKPKRRVVAETEDEEPKPKPKRRVAPEPEDEGEDEEVEEPKRRASPKKAETEKKYDSLDKAFEDLDFDD